MERKRYVHCEQTGRTRRRSGRQSRRGTSRRAPGSRCGRTGLVAVEGMGAATPRCGHTPGLRPRAAGEDSRCVSPFSFRFSFPLSESALPLSSRCRRACALFFPSLVLNPAGGKLGTWISPARADSPDSPARASLVRAHSFSPACAPRQIAVRRPTC